jgi:hypothetical protein
VTKFTKAFLTVLDIILYSSIIIATELTKTFNLLGTEKIKTFTSWDWTIEFVGIWAVAGVIIRAYFDKSNQNRQDKVEKKEAETAFLTKKGTSL